MSSGCLDKADSFPSSLVGETGFTEISPWFLLPPKGVVGYKILKPKVFDWLLNQHIIIYHYLSLFIYLFFHMFFKSINSKSDQPTVPYISHCFLRFQAGSRTSQSQPWQLLGGGLVAAMPQKSPKPPAARRVCRLNTVHRGSSCVETWNPKNKIE